LLTKTTLLIANQNYATYFQLTEQTVYWIYRETGMGKTRGVTEQFNYIYWKDKRKWWDGYGK
jgi:hypothetical protein